MPGQLVSALCDLMVSFDKSSKDRALLPALITGVLGSHTSWVRSIRSSLDGDPMLPNYVELDHAFGGLVTAGRYSLARHLDRCWDGCRDHPQRPLCPLVLSPLSRRSSSPDLVRLANHPELFTAPILSPAELSSDSDPAAAVATALAGAGKGERSEIVPLIAEHEGEEEDEGGEDAEQHTTEPE